MKYIIVLGDGMSDYKDKDGNTPLTLAQIPFINSLAKKSEVGLVKTVPNHLSPGSDIANLSVLGYDPDKYYSGRSPLEAVSIGIDLKNDDVTYRLNLVTLSGDKEYENKTMLDYSAGEISTSDARNVIELLKPICPKGFEIFAGVSYRHCMVQRKAEFDKDFKLTPPHDISDKKITDYLPKGKYGGVILDFMKRSYAVLSDKSVNSTKANSAWIWGAGTKPKFDSFYDKFGKTGAMISEVDLLKGIGICAGLKSVDVEGATANLHTNYKGMVYAALDALKTRDFVFLHIEASDECGHQGDKDGKILAIEYLDYKVVKPIYDGLIKMNTPFKLLFLPDHATPLCLKTHTKDPVPYMLFDSTKNLSNGAVAYDEDNAESTGAFENIGHKLIEKLFE